MKPHGLYPYWLLDYCHGIWVLGTWTSQIPKIMDPTLPRLLILGFWAINVGALQVKAELA